MADIDIVHESSGLKPLRPADAELRRPPRRKAGKKSAASPEGEAEETEPDTPPPGDPPHAVDTYA